MELKEFIATGILESYLLGTATQQEVDKVHGMLKKHPYLKIEIDTLEETLLKIAEPQKLTLSDDLKEKIFSSINFDQPRSSKYPENTSTPVKMVAIPNNNRKLILRYGIGIAATVGLLIISTIINISMFSTNKEMSNELAKLNRDHIYMQTEIQSQKTLLDKMDAQFAVLTDPDNKTVFLKGLDISPGSLATVYWNNRSSKVYLYVNNLPDAPTDKQYQLWAIIDGKPVDAGVFNTGHAQMLQSMKLASGPQAFAVTLEKKGGSSTPTLEAMYLLGEV